MKVFYSRISSDDGSQRDDRQIQDVDGFDYVLRDSCSGSIPLFERPKGKQIQNLIQSGDLNELHIHSIDRLGRNTVDVLTVWKELSELGVRIVCRNPNFQNLNSKGEPDLFSQLLISILSTMSEFERSMIRERQMEGIRIAKAKGRYGGRKIGTKESVEKFLNKPKSQKIMIDLQNGYTIADITSMRNCSSSTVMKVKKLMQTVGMG